jgi:hypothetical protein
MGRANPVGPAAAGYKDSQSANLLLRTQRSVEQTEAVQFLNPLTIQHVGLGSAWHVLDMTCIDHRQNTGTMLVNGHKGTQQASVLACRSCSAAMMHPAALIPSSLHKSQIRRYL